MIAHDVVKKAAKLVSVPVMLRLLNGSPKEIKQMRGRDVRRENDDVEAQVKGRNWSILARTAWKTKGTCPPPLSSRVMHGGAMYLASGGAGDPNAEGRGTCRTYRQHVNLRHAWSWRSSPAKFLATAPTIGDSTTAPETLVILFDGLIEISVFLPSSCMLGSTVH